MQHLQQANNIRPMSGELSGSLGGTGTFGGLAAIAHRRRCLRIHQEGRLGTTSRRISSRAHRWRWLSVHLIPHITQTGGGRTTWHE